MPRIRRSGKHVVTIATPWCTLVLLPHSSVFTPISRLPIIRRGRAFVVVDVPVGTILRVGRTPNAKYYLVDRDEMVELRGIKAKVPGLNVWGWHYKDPRTGETIVTVVYNGRRFIRVP